jgi:hypothetical protein
MEKTIVLINFSKKKLKVKYNILYNLDWLEKPAAHRGLDWTIILDFLGSILEKLESFMG